MKTFKPTIAVDLDGVLAQYDGWKGVDHIGPPIPGAAEFMAKLSQLGTVIIWTTRSSVLNADDTHDLAKLENLIIYWLEEHGIPYDRVHIAEGKPLAAVFIDDRAVCCRPQENGPTDYDVAVARAEFMTSRGQQRKPDWL